MAGFDAAPPPPRSFFLSFTRISAPLGRRPGGSTGVGEAAPLRSLQPLVAPFIFQILQRDRVQWTVHEFHSKKKLLLVFNYYYEFLRLQHTARTRNSSSSGFTNKSGSLPRASASAARPPRPHASSSSLGRAPACGSALPQGAAPRRRSKFGTKPATKRHGAKPFVKDIRGSESNCEHDSRKM